MALARILGLCRTAEPAASIPARLTPTGR